MNMNFTVEALRRVLDECDKHDVKDESCMCTKAQFCRYRILQEMGLVNMLDVNFGTELTGLSKKEYKDILFNYDNYKKAYNI